MTISYSGNFVKLIFRWKGSVWKSIWKELVVYLILYYFVRFVYVYSYLHGVVADEVVRKYEHLVSIFSSQGRGHPCKSINSIEWPDEILSLTNSLIPGEDDLSRSRRFGIARYLNLTSALAWREVSERVRRRFPTLQHLVTADLMTREELELYHSVESDPVRWYLPLQWAQQVVEQHARENMVSQPVLNNFLNHLNDCRKSFRQLHCYDWVCVPLVYTQVCALAIYTYFAFGLIGRQFLREGNGLPGYECDYYVPVFTIAEFVFFIGWFKIGQVLMRPFGTDDDDIELNYILDRNVEASYALVGSVPTQQPTLLPCWKNFADENVNERIPTIPHTVLSAKVRMDISALEVNNRGSVPFGNEKKCDKPTT